jgi:mRNA interferase RelE/StbE
MIFSMLQIQLYKQAVKFLAGLPQKQQKQIAKALLALQINTKPHDAKKLHGYEYYRVDVGEYRIIYDWNDNTVFVYIIGKRNGSDVYRKLDKRN